MAKQYKAISHVDRMHNPQHSVQCDIYLVDTFTYQNVEDVRYGIVTKKLKKVKSSVSDSLKKFRASDFCLQNLLSIGAPLNPVHLNLDQHTAMSVAEEQLSNITKTLNQE